MLKQEIITYKNIKNVGFNLTLIMKFCKKPNLILNKP